MSFWTFLYGILLIFRIALHSLGFGLVLLAVAWLVARAVLLLKRRYARCGFN